MHVQVQVPAMVHNLINMHTLRALGGVGSNIFACISDGKLAYIGRTINSPILDPSLAILSYNLHEERTYVHVYTNMK